MARRVLTTTRAADRDIRDIARYIGADNPLAATRFEDELEHTFERLREGSNVGRRHTHSAGLIRARVSERFRNYLIFYRVIGDRSVEIVRILHGARDISALLPE